MMGKEKEKERIATRRQCAHVVNIAPTGRDLCILHSIPTVSYWKSSFTLSPSGNKSPPACH